MATHISLVGGPDCSEALPLGIQNVRVHRHDNLFHQNSVRLFHTTPPPRAGICRAAGHSYQHLVLLVSVTFSCCCQVDDSFLRTNGRPAPGPRAARRTNPRPSFLPSRPWRASAVVGRGVHRRQFKRGRIQSTVGSRRTAGECSRCVKVDQDARGGRTGRNIRTYSTFMLSFDEFVNPYYELYLEGQHTVIESS